MTLGSVSDPAAFRDLVIHIGYHKAGSTLLQRHLFVPEHGVGSPWAEDFYHRNLLLVRPDSRWAGRVRDAFAPGIKQVRKDGLVPVMSCEALSGDIWRIGQSNGYGNFPVADVLATAFPGARIVMVLREQLAMIGSLYKHSMRSHWRYGLPAFLDQTPLERGMAPLLNLGYLEYSWLYETYAERCGEDNVAALPFELVRDRSAWAGKWEQILGIPVRASWFEREENLAISALTAQGKRILNHAIPATAEPNTTRLAQLVNSATHQLDQHVPLSLRQRSDARLRAVINEILAGRFCDDNQRLSGLTGTDWTTFGYQ